MTPEDTEVVVATEPPKPRTPGRDAPSGSARQRDERFLDERDRDEESHAPDRTARLYVGLWLPGAGALLAYAVMRGNYWAAFIGVELLLVGWFTLGKL